MTYPEAELHLLLNAAFNLAVMSVDEQIEFLEVRIANLHREYQIKEEDR